MEDLIAEQIDVLYYLNDIFSLKVPQISDVLEAQLVKKLFIPLYVHYLVPQKVSTEVNLNINLKIVKDKKKKKK